MKNGEADRKLFRISPADNVAVALSGEKVGHKFALRRIRAGEKVIKYGMPIGTALCDIEEGEHVHTHNLKTLLAGEEEYVYRPSPEALRVPETKRKDVFSGYARPDGSVGIRNDLWVIPTVGCANSLAENLCREMNLRLSSLNPEQGSSSFSPCPQRALPLLHPYGCSQLGEDHERTAELLAALPSRMGTSSLSSNILALSTPRPVRAESKCSIVTTETPLSEMVVLLSVLVTLGAIAGIS